MPDKHGMDAGRARTDADAALATSGGATEPPVVLFDGVCNLCTASVRFVLAHERDRDLRFAPLHTPVARAVLARAGVDDPGALPDSMTLVDADGVHLCSDAALRVCGHLRAPWRWFAALKIVPRPLRDAVYRAISTNRYRLFGKSETCALPRPGDAERFLVEDASSAAPAPDVS